MKKYIIKYKMKVNGEWEILYHETISESKRTDTMNVYVEHVTKDKKKAKRFYDLEEATRFSAVFVHEAYKTSQVIPVSK